MSVWLHILAQPLAADCMGLAALFLIVLALLHGLGSPGNHTPSPQRIPHHLHEAGHRLHKLMSRRHH